MSYTNYIGGIRKEYHHIKKHGDDEGYEPAMVITRDRIKGHSFIIPLSALWKYVDPKDNNDPKTRFQDETDFQEVRDRALWRCRMAVTDKARWIAAGEINAVIFGQALNAGTGIMLCTSYNLAKCMQLLDIIPSAPAAAQLLLWIQDGLDKLRSMPEAPPDHKTVAGEVIVFEGGHKIATKDMEVTDTELAEERSGN
jgi:hypothetical protein